MFRTVFMTFHGESRMDPHVEHHVHESPSVMTVPLMILAGLSVVGGFVGIPIIHGGNVIQEFLAPVMKGQALLAADHGGLAYAAGAQASAVHHTEALEIVLMVISLAIAIAGWFVARKFYVLQPDLPQRTAQSFGGLYRLVFNKYWVDELYDAIAVNPIVRFANWLWRVADDGIIDWIVNGLAEVTRQAAASLRRVQSGLVQNYALSIVVGVLFVLGYMVFK
jgi:NADH-quinone oxidoreductase subunit L